MLWYTPNEILKYQKNLKDGDILLYHRHGNIFNSFGAKLIQFGTQGPFNHVDMVYKKDNILRVIFADSVRGVCDREWSKVYGNTNNYIIVLRPTKLINKKRYTIKKGKEVIQTYKKYIGEKYDTISLLVFPFKMLSYRIFNKWNPFNQRGFFCSDIVTKVEQEEEVLFMPNSTSECVSPNDIFMSVKSKLKLIDLTAGTDTNKASMFKHNNSYIRNREKILKQLLKEIDIIK